MWGRRSAVARQFAGTQLPLLVLGLLLMAGLVAGSTGSALAAPASSGGAQFAVQPVTYDPSMPDTRAYFIFNSTPGAVLHSRVRVTNSGTAAGSARLYAVDATTGATSGTVYQSAQAPRQDVGAWITLDQSSVLLAPGQSRVVDYTLRIPQTVRSGQHVGGIVAEDATVTSTSAGNMRINVQHLAITGVLISLPGTPVHQLTATGAAIGGQNGSQSVTLALHNTGTMLEKPNGDLLIGNAAGQTLQDVPLHLDTFLPQTSIAFPVYMTHAALTAGTYWADLTLTYGNGQLLHYHTPFTVTAAQLAQIFPPRAQATPPPLETLSYALTHLDIQTVFASTLFWQLLFILLLLGVLLHILFKKRRMLYIQAAWQTRRLRRTLGFTAPHGYVAYSRLARRLNRLTSVPRRRPRTLERAHATTGSLARAHATGSLARAHATPRALERAYATTGTLTRAHGTGALERAHTTTGTLTLPRPHGHEGSRSSHSSTLRRRQPPR